MAKVGRRKDVLFVDEWCEKAQSFVTGYWDCTFIENTTGGPVLGRVDCDYAKENGCLFASQNRTCWIFEEKYRK
ncbi:MAG: hypothetical protein J6C25_08505 [Treponema sp.]|nr:hypothetical protein [Treponema sp.]